MCVRLDTASQGDRRTDGRREIPYQYRASFGSRARTISDDVWPCILAKVHRSTLKINIIFHKIVVEQHSGTCSEQFCFKFPTVGLYFCQNGEYQLAKFIVKRTVSFFYLGIVCHSCYLQNFSDSHCGVVLPPRPRNRGAHAAQYKIGGTLKKFVGVLR